MRLSMEPPAARPSSTVWPESASASATPAQNLLPSGGTGGGYMLLNQGTKLRNIVGLCQFRSLNLLLIEAGAVYELRRPILPIRHPVGGAGLWLSPA